MNTNAFFVCDNIMGIVGNAVIIVQVRPWPLAVKYLHCTRGL